MTQPRLTAEERESMDAVSHLCDDPIKNGIRKMFAIRKEHAAAMALLEDMRKHAGMLFGRHWTDRIDELLGKKAPTLEEFNDCIKSGSPLVSCYAHSFTDFTAFVSRDGTRLARVTVEAEWLVIRCACCAAQASQVPETRYQDAPSAVEFVARFLGAE